MSLPLSRDASSAAGNGKQYAVLPAIEAGVHNSLDGGTSSSLSGAAAGQTLLKPTATVTPNVTSGGVAASQAAADASSNVEQSIAMSTSSGMYRHQRLEWLRQLGSGPSFEVKLQNRCGTKDGARPCFFLPSPPVAVSAVTTLYTARRLMSKALR